MPAILKSQRVFLICRCWPGVSSGQPVCLRSFTPHWEQVGRSSTQKTDGGEDPYRPLKGRFTTPPNSSHTDQPAGAAAHSEVELGQESESVVGESDLFKADGSPELKHLVEGNAEDEFDVGLCGLLEQRRQNQSNAPGSVAERRGRCKAETRLIRRATPAHVLQTTQIRLDRDPLKIAPAIMRHAEERHARSNQWCQLGTDWFRAEERPVDRKQSFRLQKEIPMECIVVAEHLGQSIKCVEELLTMCPQP
jgi:hypothetical protein